LLPRYVGATSTFEVHATLEQPTARKIGCPEQEVFVIDKVYPSKSGHAKIKAGEGVFLKDYKSDYIFADEAGSIYTYDASRLRGSTEAGGRGGTKRGDQQRRFIIARGDKESEMAILMPSLATAEDAIHAGTVHVETRTGRPFWNLWSPDLITYGSVLRKGVDKNTTSVQYEGSPPSALPPRNTLILETTPTPLQ